MTNIEIREQAQKALEAGNPYTANAIKYYIGGNEVYLRNGKTCTKEELDNAYIETAMKDIKNGYNERMVGYYDKWYRYNHADEGRAYDIGQKLAAQNPKCSDEFHIIEA